MRTYAIMLPMAVIMWVHPGSLHAEMQVLIDETAEITVNVHAGKLFAVSVPFRIKNAEVGNLGYHTNVYSNYVTVSIPEGGKDTNFIIWGADGVRVIVNLHVVDSAADAVSYVDFVSSGHDDVGSLEFIDDEAPAPTVTADTVGTVAADSAGGETQDPRRSYWLSVVSMAGHWKTRGDGYVEDAPLLLLGICGARQSAHRFALRVCASHLAPTRALFKPAACVSVGPCDAKLKYATQAATLSAGGSARFGGTWFFTAQARVGMIARYNRVSWLLEFKADADIDFPIRTHNVTDRNWRISMLGAAGLGIGFRILPTLEIVAGTDIMASVAASSRFNAVGGRLYVRKNIL